MLEVVIPSEEYYDEVNNSFETTKEVKLQLEHSLVSISKWEAKWHKAYLGKQEKTREETLDYVKCMTMTQRVDPEVYQRIPDSVINQINAYINDPMTATTIREIDDGKKSNETVTSELIYYWMITLNIPPEYQKWHLNRLLTLVKVCNVKNSPPKKMSLREQMQQNAKLNAERKKKLGSHG